MAVLHIGHKALYKHFILLDFREFILKFVLYLHVNLAHVRYVISPKEVT